jgi:hypothetical protein
MSFVVRALLGVISIACPALAQAQSAPVGPSAPTVQKPPATPPSVAAPPSAAAPPSPSPLHVYMRSESIPLTFTAHSESSRPTSCISPCDLRLPAGDYQLKLNGRAVEGTVALRQPGTLHGQYESRAGMRSAAWLALNLGGIIGGVFITVGIAGGSKAAFAVGGGVLAGAGVRDMPDPAAVSGARHAALDRNTPGSTPRGLGFRVAF